MKKLLVVASVLAALGACGLAEACSCRGESSPAEAFTDAKLVFRGRVESFGKGPAAHVPRSVRFSVSRVWKGAVTAHHVIYTGFGGPDCGFPFEIGQEYVIYARSQRYETDEKGERVGHFVPATSSCGRTATVATAEQDLTYLETLKASAPRGR